MGDLDRQDIISRLPDELLGRILSFLPTKYAVATSILSSRWKNPYKLTTTLDFDDSISLSPSKDLGIRRRSNASFKKFVSEILENCKSSQITKFRLKWKHNVEPRLLHEWLNAVLVHKLAEFDLSIIAEMRVNGELSFGRLTCENLVVLKLDCSLLLSVPNSVSFPRLKILFCRGITFHGDGSGLSLIDDDAHYKSSSNYHGLNGILSGCQSLEELVIEGCKWNGGDLYFTNSKLRSLTFHCGLDSPDFDQLNGCTVYMNLPNLVYFNYSECIAAHYEISNLKSIIEAHIDIGFNEDELEGADLCKAILELIKGVRCCHTLDLSSHCLEALTSARFKLPTFRNMTRLQLALGHDVSWNDVLLDFLNSSSCLESLTLVQEILREDCSPADVAFSLEDKAVPSCVRYRLRIINIREFRGFQGEMQMVRYFLNSANVLEEMVIHWDKNRTQNIAAKEKEILELPKSSLSCSISFK